MKGYTLQPRLKDSDIHIGCCNCSTAARIAPMNMWIAVGFGYAAVTKDGETVYSERNDMSESEIWTTQTAETLAAADPNHDWRIVKHGPLHGETFQRQGKGKWYCIESNQGFA